MQLVQSILITYDINIIKYGSHLAVTERYFEFCAGIVQPGILLDPVILLGILQVILEYLLEQSEVVIQTDTVPGSPRVAMESRKQAASLPKPPLPREGSGSASSMSTRFLPFFFRISLNSS